MHTPVRFAHLLALSLLLTLSVGLGCEKDGADGSANSGTPGGAAKPAAEQPPQTEEGLVEWVSKSIENKDFERLSKAIGQEQRADFKRDMERDPVGFWDRGKAWVENVKSGFTVAHRSDGSVKRWKALIKFGNGKSETVVFARVGERLMFEKL